MLLPFILFFFVDILWFNDNNSIRVFGAEVNKLQFIMHEFINFILKDLSLPIFSGFIIYYLRTFDEKIINEKVGKFGDLNTSNKLLKDIGGRLDQINIDMVKAAQYLNEFEMINVYDRMYTGRDSETFYTNLKSYDMLQYIEESIKDHETPLSGYASPDGSYFTFNEKHTGFLRDSNKEKNYNEFLKAFDSKYDAYYNTLTYNKDNIFYYYYPIMSKNWYFD